MIIFHVDIPERSDTRLQQSCQSSNSDFAEIVVAELGLLAAAAAGIIRGVVAEAWLAEPAARVSSSSVLLPMLLLSDVAGLVALAE
jgi:cytosine/uracil/thiamine/allantoin permease